MAQILNRKPVAEIRQEEANYREVRRKYNIDPRAEGPPAPIATMFNLLEPVLFEHNRVTLQAVDPKATRFLGLVSPRHHAFPDNLVYKDGVDWELIRDNLVLTQICEEAFEEIVEKEVKRFADMKYTPFSIPPFEIWGRFAYESFVADPGAFAATLDSVRILTLRAELVTVDARAAARAAGRASHVKRKR
jgi:hypothetical protein